MARIKNKRNKKRVKLYKKVRNVSSWGTLGVLLFLNLIFIGSIIFVAGFFCQYLLETKIDEDYGVLVNIAKMYESADGSNGLLEYIEKTDRTFIVKDRSGKIIYQKGINTCSDEFGYLYMANGAEQRKIYTDTKFGLLYAGEDKRMGLDLFKALKIISDNTQEDLQNGDSIQLPIWIAVSINGGEKEFIGKANFSFNKKDTTLAFEVLSAVTMVILTGFVILIVFMVRSIINFRRVVNLFYADQITGGHNWIWFVMNGDERLRSRKFRKLSFAVVNLTFMNYRNYCMCHSITEGEEILTKIDKSLNRQIRGLEMCARANTADFALLLYYADEPSLRARLTQMMQILQRVDVDHNFIFEAGADIIMPNVNGGTFLKREDVSIEKAYNNACTAVDAQGETDPEGVFIFDEKLLEEQRWQDIVQEKQIKAIANNEFEVYYQPKYDPKTLELGGAEALIRWNSPEYGFVSPGRFIPIFEKNGFITEIDHFMISHVAANQRMWLDMGYKVGCVSVNVSRAHFAEKDLAVQIRDMVDAAGCPHDLLEIELTESAFFDDQNAMIETIKALKSFGFKVSMDDFGAGYSSLNSLKDMPLDVLKLDAGFFRGDKAGERGQIVVSETIKLAKNLHMKTVAEGVDEKEQVEFLASQGCDLIQGYYFAKPMPKADYAARLTRVAAPAAAPAAVPAAPAVPVVQTAPVAPAAPVTPPAAPVQQPVQQPIQQPAPQQPVPPQQ